MTLTATTNKVAYAGNGSTTSFAVTFIYWEDTTVKVILSNDVTGVETVWTDGTQYTLSGGDGAVGTLTIDTSPTDYTPASGETLTIKSNHPDTQTSSLPLGGAFPSTTVEDRLDKNVRLAQQLQEELDRAVLFPESSTSTGKSIEDPVALNLLRWNSAASSIEGVSLSDLSLGLGTATKWTFDSSTSMGDPGTGDIRLNNATLASVTQIAVDATSAQTGNPDISDWVASWDDSTNDAVRGTIMIHEDGTPANFWVGNINGPIVDNTGWLQIPVTHLDSAGVFTAADNLVVSFSRSGDAGAGGIDMLWDADTTDADSGAGKVWLNNGTLASVTVVYIDDVDSNGVNINTLVDTFDDSTTSALRGTIKITQKGTPATYAIYHVTGAVTSASTYSKVAVAHVVSNGTFTDGDPIYLEFVRSGNQGIGGLSMTWETTTTDTDQGAGKCFVDNATLSSATVFYMDDVDANGADVNAYVDTWDDSTNRPTRGTLIVRELASPANFVIFSVTGAVTSASTYSKIAVTHVATGGSMTDGNAMSVEFYKAGNAIHSGLDMLWDADTADSDSGAGKVWFNNGTLASVSIVYVDDVDANSTSINSYIDSLDDSTNRSIRGTITVKNKSNEAVFAKYNVTGAVTSASTYSKIAVTHVVSAGSFSDGDYISFQFDRAGDAGVPSGLDMLWDSETSDTDSGAGKIYFNNGTLASVTVVYVDDVDANATSINSYVDSWDDSTNLDLRGTITVKKKTDTAVFAKYNVTGVVTSASTYSKVAVTHVVSAGSFTDADPVTVDFVRSGDRGPNAGLDMSFETTTTDTDQGAGKLWLNNGTISSASIVYLDDVDDNAVSINSFVDSFDDSTSTVKGHIQFEKQFDPAVFALFNVTGSVTSASTYSKIASTYVTGAGSFGDGDKISVTFIRAGDKGSTGSTGAAGSDGEASNGFVIAMAVAL
tara:strand:- start:251 stop:3073 length:2823 start_codon:yes stop_codon:yes gene_type:complete